MIAFLVETRFSAPSVLIFRTTSMNHCHMAKIIYSFLWLDCVQNIMPEGQKINRKKAQGPGQSYHIHVISYPVDVHEPATTDWTTERVPSVPWSTTSSSHQRWCDQRLTSVAVPSVPSSSFPLQPWRCLSLTWLNHGQGGKLKKQTKKPPKTGRAVSARQSIAVLGQLKLKILSKRTKMAHR